MQRDMTRGALSAAEVAALMDRRTPWPQDGQIALAVSGGPDSMAMAFLIQQWCEQKALPPPLALIVDHALRPESGAEAAGVQEHLRDMGIGAEILLWNHAPVTARLHSEARKARYSLLLDACRRHQRSALLFAHQREDQAETILMRFAKGTGLDGLAGIPAEHTRRGIRIVRPFLTVPKERLVATCEAARIPFVTDPSNGLAKFARGRMRRVMPMLAEDGLTVERLIDFGARAAEARDALNHSTSEFLARSSYRTDYGVISIDKMDFLAVPRAIALRGLSLALQAVHAEAYAPPHASLALLVDAMVSEDILTPRTLHGCRISQNKQRVTITRELSGITETVALKAGETLIWDGRWRLELVAAPAADSYRVQALGHPPHDILDRLAPTLRRKVPQGRVRAALPALWSGADIVAIPFFEQSPTAKVELMMIWPPHNKN